MIHSTAIVDASAKLGTDVSIGPYCVIGPDVEIQDGSVLRSHVVVKGPTVIGKNNQFFQFCSIGEDCQDKKYAGEPTQLIIGDNNVFRECATVHRGTIQDQGVTRIGSDNLFMAYIHIAHDCVLGDNNILANNATLAGHVVLGDFVILGGMTGIHQFCHVGSHSFAGVGSVIVKDLPPYIMAGGSPFSTFGINAEGLRRRNFSADAILQIKRAYKAVYRQGKTVNEALAVLEDMAVDCSEINLFVDFIKQSKRGIVR